MREDGVLNAIRGGNMGPDEYRVLNKPRSCVYRTGAANAVNNANTQYNFDTVDYDTDSMVDIVNQPSRLTVNTPGVYLVIADIAFTGNNVGWRRSWVRKTTPAGVASLYGSDTRIDPTTIGVWCHSVAEVPANQGDYFEAVYFQNSGGVLAVAVSTAINRDNNFCCSLVSTLG